MYNNDQYHYYSIFDRLRYWCHSRVIEILKKFKININITTLIEEWENQKTTIFREYAKPREGNLCKKYPVCSKYFVFKFNNNYYSLCM